MPERTKEAGQNITEREGEIIALTKLLRWAQSDWRVYKTTTIVAVVFVTAEDTPSRGDDGVVNGVIRVARQ